ncbi:GIY-YIG nuclease family protein [Nostoc sp. LPT]|uniref:GIY-YIG nuclease family protein n=1 Tax=Nostoc sp. LPT TaxID=2815387 RepID=UPI0025E9ADBE|nr:GIY-YIG nuclease family protein [Nostoc sp. LPT]
MPTNDSELQAQARKILDAIAFIPFEQCQPLTRDFATILVRPGIYAIRHKTDGLLYIGKTKSLRGRFSGGHKAFLWAWLDKYNDEDVRIAVQFISTLGKPYVTIGARSHYFKSHRTSLQRPNSNRRVVKRCKPNSKSNFPPMMPKLF